MDAARRDADLRAEAEAVAVGEARRAVVEDVGRVDAAQELLGDAAVLGDDDVGVPAAVLMNVLNGRAPVRINTQNSCTF